MVDAIHREKNIDKDIIFAGLESAIESVAAKKFPFTGEISAEVNRETGELSIQVDGDPIDPQELGRIAAQNVYQIIMQKIKEAENDVIFLDYKKKEGTLVSGVVRRIEKNSLWVNIGDIDGLLPVSEQIKGERYQLGERIRCIIKTVKKENNSVVIILSRNTEKLVCALFELEIPEISNGIIEIKAIVREPGARSKIAVYSSDSNIDCIGACVGVKGSRIWAVINEVNEKIDIIKWDENPKVFITNALSPAEISSVELVPAISYARIIVDKSQVPLAIGKGGLNIKLSSRITGWELDVFDTEEILEIKSLGEQDLKSLPGVGDKIYEEIRKHDLCTLEELLAFGKTNLLNVKGVSEETADQILEASEKLLEVRLEEKESQDKE